MSDSFDSFPVALEEAPGLQSDDWESKSARPGRLSLFQAWKRAGNTD